MAGLREWKKQVTRQHISDVATRLILDRGFDDVGVREIARAAHVSPTTLFAYFPSKEAMFLDRDEELEEQLVATVRERPLGTTALGALKELMLARMRLPDHPEAKRFIAAIRDTPQLSAYWREIGRRHRDTLARVLAEAWDRDEDDPYAQVVATIVLDLRQEAITSDTAAHIVDATFDLLERGLPFESQ